MKVIQEKPKTPFMPITIILETEEEASEMWHRFNIITDLFKQHPGEFNKVVALQMMTKLNQTFRPKGL